MDKKNTSIGILLLIAAFALMFYNAKTRVTQPQPTQPLPTENVTGTPPPSETISAAAPNPAAQTPVEAAAAASQPISLQSQSPQLTTLFVPTAPTREDEQFTTLGNEFIEARFTNYGGAIAEVALKKHRANKTGPETPLVLNAERHAPMLAFARLPGADADTPYERVSATANQVVFRTVLGGRLEIVRSFTVSANPETQDPYVIRSETIFRNLSNAPITGGSVALNLGTARMVHETDDGLLLQAGRFDGKAVRLTSSRELSDEGFFTSIGLSTAQPRPYVWNPGAGVWATVENQFFATIALPSKPGTGLLVRRVELPHLPADLRPRYGLTADLSIDTGTLSAGGSESLSVEIYAGPKEFNRLERLGNSRDEVMQWGWFGFFAKILLTLMKTIHGLVEGSAWSWGWAIILTTVVIRTLMWPLTGMSTRAAKRMAKISGPLKELQEKYKDNKQKLTEETMKLWKEHKVNPVAGCLPILLQMPIFIGLFSMLRSAAELRFGEFLWINDLSAPDTVATIPLLLFNLPINPMPILMGVTSMIQMRMTPTPTTDNPSAKMMKFMPILFTVLCYGFSSGLSVYWTFSNMFSIFQQWVTNRRKDPVEIAPVKPGAAERAKPVKDAKVSSVPGPKKKK